MNWVFQNSPKILIFQQSDRRKCQLPNELKANAEIKHCGFSLTAKKYLSLSPPILRAAMNFLEFE